MRKFEKVSKEQLFKDGFVDEFNTVLPVRSTKASAGYDISAYGNHVIHPGEIKKIPTGLKVSMPEDEVLLVIIRSSLGIKYNISLVNAVGVIDSDYYNNIDNEGHFWAILKNHGEEDFAINHGDRVCQGIFMKYGTTEDDNVTKVREGGFGSTGKSS